MVALGGLFLVFLRSFISWEISLLPSASVVFLKQLEVFFFNICLLGEGTVLYTRKIYMQITLVIHETLH